MVQAIAQARRHVWVATYIFHDGDVSKQVADALLAATQRGVAVSVVVDGFGAKGSLERLRAWFEPAGIAFAVFRRADRWWQVVQPGQLRRLHQKLCVVDDEVGFVGGINLLDDRFDLRHGN